MGMNSGFGIRGVRCGADELTIGGWKEGLVEKVVGKCRLSSFGPRCPVTAMPNQDSNDKDCLVPSRPRTGDSWQVMGG